MAWKYEELCNICTNVPVSVHDKGICAKCNKLVNSFKAKAAPQQSAHPQSENEEYNFEIETCEEKHKCCWCFKVNGTMIYTSKWESQTFYACSEECLESMEKWEEDIPLSYRMEMLLDTLNKKSVESERNTISIVVDEAIPE